MPWSPQDSLQHKKGSPKIQQRKWAKIANAILQKSGDEGEAIRIANKKVDESQQTNKKDNDMKEGIFQNTFFGMSRYDIEIEIQKLANKDFRHQEILQSELHANDVKRIDQLSNNNLRNLYIKLKNITKSDAFESIEQAIDMIIEFDNEVSKNLSENQKFRVDFSYSKSGGFDIATFKNTYSFGHDDINAIQILRNIDAHTSDDLGPDEIVELVKFKGSVNIIVNRDKFSKEFKNKFSVSNE